MKRRVEHHGAKKWFFTFLSNRDFYLAASASRSWPRKAEASKL
ncbi:hypothetical protein EV213_10368 [Aureibacillus halotolerans]|uniref:Uncharacterized protein n=1 Tax=Aureibacillus halotolerans TaxID=1508390 RepID=A0A4R6U4T3_9BACI|nr:hypothetical protein EV213_10368 [Aureibacillus halotolerans]